MFSTAFVFGQVREFNPTILSIPDLNPDTLKWYEALSIEYHEIVKNETPYEALTDAQKKLFEDELKHAVGPYSTEPLGCSWYCAGGPSGLTSTSNLESAKAISYKADNAHDFDLTTAWIEGKDDYGIGEELNIEFDLLPNLKVTHINIYNGYSKSLRVWKENSRVKKFKLFINGEYLGNLNLQDTYKAQRFEIGDLGGNSDRKLLLTLKIIDVYEGEKYADTAISEINFDGTGDH